MSLFKKENGKIIPPCPMHCWAYFWFEIFTGTVGDPHEYIPPVTFRDNPGRYMRQRICRHCQAKETLKIEEKWEG